MARETDLTKLAERSERFKTGAKKRYDDGPDKGDMWLFELYHHLTDCAAALHARAQPEKR